MQRELVERARSGDHEAFSDLARASIDRQYAIATLILRDGDRAQDAVQEALVSAWRDLRALRDPDAWDAWLHRLTVRACYRLARKERRRTWSSCMWCPIRNRRAVIRLRALASPNATGMERELDRLPSTSGPCMVLHFYLDLPLTEAADILDIPVGTAKSRLHRGLEALRASMRDDPDVATAQGPGADWHDQRTHLRPPAPRADGRACGPGDTAPAIDNVVTVTRSLRPEPRWLVLLKERPMRTSSVLVAGSPPMRTGLVFAIIALLVAVAATIAVGALVLRQPTVPPAYGPAGNGLIAYAAGGDIVVTDASGTQTTPITSGPAIDSMPQFSRDGTRIAFRPQREPGSTARQVMVANADGTGAGCRLASSSSRPRRSTGPQAGDRLALLGEHPDWDALTPSVFVAGAGRVGLDRGSRLGALDPRGVRGVAAAGGRRARLPRPPGASAIRPRPCTRSRPRPAPSQGRSWSRRRPSPSRQSRGRRARAVPRRAVRHLLDLGPERGRGERRVGARARPRDRGPSGSPPPGAARPARSPRTGAGSWGSAARLEVEPLDGSAPSRTLGPEIEPAGVHVAISPDGTTVLVTESSGARTLVDVETGAATPLDVSSEDLASWQRTAVP